MRRGLAWNEILIPISTFRSATLTSAAGEVRYNEPIAHPEDVVMLTNEMKRQAFLKLRTENYRASLRLEGLTPRPATANKPAPATATLKTKHA